MVKWNNKMIFLDFKSHRILVYLSQTILTYNAKTDLRFVCYKKDLSP